MILNDEIKTKILDQQQKKFKITQLENPHRIGCKMFIKLIKTKKIYFFCNNYSWDSQLNILLINQCKINVLKGVI